MIRPAFKEDFGRPKSIVPAFEFEIERSAVQPTHTVRRRGDGDLRPVHARVSPMREGGTPLCIQNPPVFFEMIPDDSGIGRAVVIGIEEKRFGNFHFHKMI